MISTISDNIIRHYLLSLVAAVNILLDREVSEIFDKVLEMHRISNLSPVLIERGVGRTR